VPTGGKKRNLAPFAGIAIPPPNRKGGKARKYSGAGGRYSREVVGKSEEDARVSNLEERLGKEI